MPSTPSRSHGHRMPLLAALTAILTVLGVLVFAPPARAVGPVYSGSGWKAWTSNGIYSINPDPYVIVFASTTARSKLTPYLTGPAGQITTATGVRVTVSTTIDTTPVGTCPARHRVIVSYSYRPTGVKGMSEARACHQTTDGSAWGGHLRMDSEYWTVASWFSTNATTNEAWRKDAVTHELGHIMGLAHPNVDLDKDGVVEARECVKNSAGLRPIMCSPNRGPVASTYGGKYTSEFDVPGLRQMALNWYLRQP